MTDSGSQANPFPSRRLTAKLAWLGVLASLAMALAIGGASVYSAYTPLKQRSEETFSAVLELSGERVLELFGAIQENLDSIARHPQLVTTMLAATKPVEGADASGSDLSELLARTLLRMPEFDGLLVIDQRAQLRKQYDEAMAKRDRAQINIISAQTAQADAQLALIDERLSRTHITAPFSGVIISGDLSQSLGASVRRGDVLFEIAPLDTYRVILKVNEHDINDVEVNQSGELVLSAMSDTVFPFTVERITPVSTAEEGENYFRVEAVLSNNPETVQRDMARLRPGMEGAGKISIDQRKLIWIWTHDIIDRLRLWVWRWLT